MGEDMKLTVDNQLIRTLSALHINSNRGGMHRSPPNPGIRWKVGDSLDFQKNTYIEEYSTIAAGNALISAGSFSTTASPFPVNTILGRYVAIGPGCRPLGFRHPVEAVCINSAIYNFYRENIYPYFQNYEQIHGKLEKKPVPTPQPNSRTTIIGPDVWFASNVTFTPGIKVGTGAIIASNSVVTKDVPPYSFVAGVPAKVKKMRFEDNIIEKLLESNWWNYELGDLFKLKLDFSSPINFLNKFNEVKHNLSLYQPKVFYPLEYVARCIHKLILPENCLLTDHISILGIDYLSKKLIHKRDINHNAFCHIEAHFQNEFAYLYLPKLNRWISNIDRDSVVQLSDSVTPFAMIKNKNKTISIISDGGYVSANRLGTCAVRDWNREWEQFFVSSNFKNSYLGYP